MKPRNHETLQLAVQRWECMKQWNLSTSRCSEMKCMKLWNHETCQHLTVQRRYRDGSAWNHETAKPVNILLSTNGANGEKRHETKTKVSKCVCNISCLTTDTYWGTGYRILHVCTGWWFTIWGEHKMAGTRSQPTQVRQTPTMMITWWLCEREK